MTPMLGGHSSETFVADAAGERTVVRVYAERGARRGENPVTEQAHDLLLAIARTGDLHAVPSRG